MHLRRRALVLPAAPAAVLGITGRRGVESWGPLVLVGTWAASAPETHPAGLWFPPLKYVGVISIPRQD